MTASEMSVKLLTALMVQEIAIFSLGAWMLHRRRVTLREAGLVKPAFQDVKKGILLGLFLFCAGALVAIVQMSILKTVLSPHLMSQLNQYSGRSGADKVYGILKLPWARMLFILTGMTVAPIAEETLFRGWLYAAFKDRIGVVPAVIASSLLFALAHLTLLQIAPIFAIGVILTVIYETTHSLTITAIMHSVNNTLSFGLLMALSHSVR